MRTKLIFFRWLIAAALGLSAIVAEAASTSYFIYDESGHVIGEYDANGNPVQEHIYLGDKPVAVVQGGGTVVDNVTTDQLNTPRVVTNSSQAVIWTWNSDPFGNGQPTGSLTYNLRFPGQYYDVETRHNYNDHRDYDPSSGRYIESDPIGLSGGLNTYSYAVDNPEGNVDPAGLCVSGVYPISFSYDSKDAWAQPGKWTMQASDAEGGERDSPWFSVRCYCWRQKNGVRFNTIRIKWREKDCPFCNSPGNTHDYWGDPITYQTDISTVEHKTFAWYTINSEFSDDECQKKCDSLNLQQ